MKQMKERNETTKNQPIKRKQLCATQLNSYIIIHNNTRQSIQKKTTEDKTKSIQTNGGPNYLATKQEQQSSTLQTEAKWSIDSNNHAPLCHFSTGSILLSAELLYSVWLPSGDSKGLGWDPK